MIIGAVYALGFGPRNLTLANAIQPAASRNHSTPGMQRDGRCATLRAPRRVRLHHRALAARMTQGLSSSLILSAQVTVRIYCIRSIEYFGWHRDKHKLHEGKAETSSARTVSVRCKQLVHGRRGMGIPE